MTFQGDAICLNEYACRMAMGKHTNVVLLTDNQPGMVQRLDKRHFMNSASIKEDLCLQERFGRQRLTFSVLDVLEFLKFLTK